MKWKNPPPAPARGRPTVYREVGRQLMSKPGKWAVVREDTYPGTVNQIRVMLMKYVDNDASHWEVVSRRREGESGYNPKVDIYARYLKNGKDA